MPRPIDSREVLLKQLANLVRYFILSSTTAAKSGHPTSCLSATDVLTALFFGGYYHFDLNQPTHPNNDRLLFSKGHAAPLLYSLYAAAGAISETELMTLRQFGSPLEGHPTRNFKYTEVATGSLGMGLSIGVGMALNAQYVDKLPYTTYVLLGDSEMAEGSNWESLALASHYKLSQLVGILDVNRLGQRGQTMQGHDIDDYVTKIEAFGWETIAFNGHNWKQILAAFDHCTSKKRSKPLMLIAKTMKGKGISFLEDEEYWHGKPLSQQQLDTALTELQPIDTALRASLPLPENLWPNPTATTKIAKNLPRKTNNQLSSVRTAVGQALVSQGNELSHLIVLDAEVSNSTCTSYFKDAFPERFFEMFIAEQNMVGAAVGLASRGKVVVTSTFASFLTRAFDQLRLAQYSQSNLTMIGSHAGVSIGPDGPSQMGLEDIALFRSIHNSVVIYPSDSISTQKLLPLLLRQPGICYLRSTRGEVPTIYSENDQFMIGGSKLLKHSKQDQITLIGAGVTVHECLKAAELLAKESITARVIDLYSIKPLDITTLEQAASQTNALFVVEDHYPEGGIAEAVRSALGCNTTPLFSHAVKKLPRSGSPEELLEFEELSASAIVTAVKAAHVT